MKMNRTYTVNADVVTNIKTPQFCACVAILKDTQHGGQVTESELEAAIIARRAELNTRQDPWLIFQYYRPQMVNAGLLSIPGKTTVPVPKYWDYDDYRVPVIHKGKYLDPQNGIQPIA